jgi:polar amino acid transport system substrate-binding protein
MRTIPWLTAVVVGLLIAGCASVASAASQEERLALAPTGKLRVALYLGAPASIIRGATLDESKGVGFDLGKELARRIGVPFEPVVYPSPGAIMDGLKAGEWDLTFFGPTPERERVLNFTAPFSSSSTAISFPPVLRSRPSKQWIDRELASVRRRAGP